MCACVCVCVYGRILDFFLGDSKSARLRVFCVCLYGSGQWMGDISCTLFVTMCWCWFWQQAYSTTSRFSDVVMACLNRTSVPQYSMFGFEACRIIILPMYSSRPDAFCVARHCIHRHVRLTRTTRSCARHCANLAKFEKKGTLQIGMLTGNGHCKRFYVLEGNLTAKTETNV